MAPTEKDAYIAFRACGRLPAQYPPFNPLIYSVEVCVPLVKLGQDDRWQPDPVACPPAEAPPEVASRRRRIEHWLAAHILDPFVTPTRLHWIRWIMIGFGWLLVTFFVAGITGIVKSN